jgi:Zn-dependent peptidase ImmA (M78 family)/transcriptional regulator with XRE-family HTH domain
MAIHLEVDPARLQSLRTRLKLPLAAGAKRAHITEDQLASWERDVTTLPVDTLQALATAYNRNWYIFLLDEEIGKPAVPHDFRRPRGGPSALTSKTLLAFDNAALLLDRIESLNPVGESIIDSRGTRLSDNPEAIAASFRKSLGVVGAPEKAGAYSVLKSWRETLASAGLYVAQVQMPPKEVRAFCVSRNLNHLIVLSIWDWPTARSFSLLHEVGHLLLGADAMCRPEETGAADSSSPEPWCNRFAAAVLMPKDVLEANPKFHELINGNVTFGSGRSLAKDFGVSELALMRRLETFGHISRAEYQALQEESDEYWKDNPEEKSTGRLLHHEKIIARQSALFVRQVLDAHSKGDISYREIGSLLNTPLRSIPQIREAVA